MFNKIGNIVVIGLEAREDRWKRCEEIFQQNAISPVTHYTTVQDFQDTHRHYMKDFLNMLRTQAQGEYLCFFEDDFEFVDDWQSILRRAWEQLPADFDMLYLGANLTAKPNIIDQNLVRVKGAYLMHSCIMSRKFIRYILKEYDYNVIRIIDEWYRMMAPQLKFYMTYPMISYQRNDFSDFLGQYVYYDIFNNPLYLQLHENYRNGSWVSTASERRGRVDAA
jgi:hypothetical protein